jgi:hypothetical protein
LFPFQLYQPGRGNFFEQDLGGSMANPAVRLLVMAINGFGNRQSRNYRIERGVFDPANTEHLQKYGFHLLGNALKMSSRGLQQAPAAQLQAFAIFLLNAGTDSALYADNNQSDWLYQQGHVYEYRSPLFSISANAAVFIRENPNNSMRLLLHTFPNDALELPVDTVARMRERMKGGARDGALLHDLQDDTTIKAYQHSQWDTQASVVGDVMLGHNAIVVNTRQVRSVLENDRYVVDIINPATREFHNLDGSAIWIRIVDTAANKLLFAVVGTGKHRYTMMDALNNWGAMSIWHCMALVQLYLYEEVPSTYAEIATHIVRARQLSSPDAHKIYQTLSSMDTDRAGAFLRGLRTGHVSENGDGYLST